MHHVVAPLDPDHRQAALRLIDQVCAAAGVPEARWPVRQPHVTLVAFEGIAPGAAVEALRDLTGTGTTAPLVVRAHGYGLFAGGVPSQICLFVPVVRDQGIDRLQRRIGTRLEEAGAIIAGHSRPAVWTPHVTLFDRCLEPVRLSRVVEQLARRAHPSWNVRLDTIELDGTRLDLTGR
jgi:2'-5' RNA ligase